MLENLLNLVYSAFASLLFGSMNGSVSNPWKRGGVNDDFEKFATYV